jgi:phage gp36-like protein
MAYATPEDFIRAFGEPETVQLTNLDNPNTTAVNLVPLERALFDATGIIDMYVGNRYVLPLTVGSTVINGYCLDIARYRLDRINPRDDVRLRYEDALKQLQLVTKGIVSLGANFVGQSIDATAIDRDGSGARSCREPSIDLGGF